MNNNNLKYDFNLENKKSNNNKSHYIGARALFDPLFIPDSLINRSKEEDMIRGLLKDSTEDGFPTNISIYGMKGIGKTVLINKSIRDLKQIFYDNNKEPKNEIFLPIYINCESKEFEEILFNIAERLMNFKKMDLNYDFILNSDLVKIWNLIKLAIQKIKTPIILFLDSLEFIEPHIANKLTIFNKSEKIIQITSFNMPKCSPYLYEYEKPDWRLELGIYSNKDLLKISQDRCALAFKTPIEIDLHKFIIDLVTQFDKKIPGPIINILRELYPLIENSNNLSKENSEHKSHIIDANRVRDLCRYQFEGFSIDELTIADFVSETDVLERIFLDNLCNYFYQTNKYYINFQELKEKYILACESIEVKMNDESFYRTIKDLEKNTNYFWRVKSFSIFGSTEYSSVYTFKTNE